MKNPSGRNRLKNGAETVDLANPETWAINGSNVYSRLTSAAAEKGKSIQWNAATNNATGNGVAW